LVSDLYFLTYYITGITHLFAIQFEIRDFSLFSGFLIDCSQLSMGLMANFGDSRKYKRFSKDVQLYYRYYQILFFEYTRKGVVKHAP